MRQRRFVFISHPIDNTGAPTVLLQIIEEFVATYGSSRVVLVSPDIADDQHRRIRELGITVAKAAEGLPFWTIRLQLALRRDDFVLMNTAAVYDNYLAFVLILLRTGRLNHAYWFIHETEAQLPAVNEALLEKKASDQIHRLLEKAKLTILTPSQQTTQEYVSLFRSDNIRSVKLRVEVDDRYKRARPASGYASIGFLLSGAPFDGRKGQFLAVSAFHSFLKDYYERSPASYRGFTLHLVAIGDDYMSRQIKWIGASLLGDRVEIHPSVSREAALEITARCNAVICCSLSETFGLYVAEGMFMGHLVLRNNSAGVDEQLRDGENGYFVDHTDIGQFAGVIEKVLNKTTNSDADLRAMGATSQAMISDYSSHTYLEQIGTR